METITENSFEIKNKELAKSIEHFWIIAGKKSKDLEKNYDKNQGSPVFTVKGRYTTRGWTEWTQGFQYGIQILAGEALKDEELISIGVNNTKNNMAHHLSHFGVHDHGFNNLSTYGNILRLIKNFELKVSPSEKDYYKLAIQLSGSVQAKRWTETKDGGYLYSFNGPHSLFIDTIRTCRILMAAHALGHRMLEENDVQINLLERVITHAKTTANYAIYYGEGRDAYDIRGRVAHESIFNINDGNYRCPNSQQGFSGFTTWTRGLAWAILGYAELLEFLQSSSANISVSQEDTNLFYKAAFSTCEFYIDHSASDGIPYWDTGAPQIHRLGNYQERESEPINDFEPIDSSAAAIAAQGFLRMASLLKASDNGKAKKFEDFGYRILNTLLSSKYLSSDENHQGLILHSIYHRPNNWDHIPKGSKIPHGESSMWGDYHMTELVLLADRINNGRYYTFFEALLD
jgi:rhamnogalacturonyl hydrolase YesR